MAAPRSSASPTPGPSNAQSRDRVADALYSWCLQNHEVGHVFDQNELLASPIIPNKDLTVLLTSSNYLVGKNLFKLHDIKATNVLGWELVSQERAAKYFTMP
jgi:RNA polymerase Rpc34 subunit